MLTTVSVVIKTTVKVVHFDGLHNKREVLV